MARPEDRLQIRCAMFCKTHCLLPDTDWTAIEHGRKHAGTAEQRAREWQRLARKGVKTSLADLFFEMRGFNLWVECKAGTNKQSPGQIAFMEAKRRIGNGYEVIRSVEQLGEALERHSIPLANNWRLVAQHHDATLETAAPIKKRSGKPRAAAPTRTQARRLAHLARAGVFLA